MLSTSTLFKYFLAMRAEQLDFCNNLTVDSFAAKEMQKKKTTKFQNFPNNEIKKICESCAK